MTTTQYQSSFQMTPARRASNADWPTWMNQAWNQDTNAVGSLSCEDYPESDGTDRLTVLTDAGRKTVEWGQWIILNHDGTLDVVDTVENYAARLDTKPLTTETLNEEPTPMKAKPRVVLHTNLGDITLELNPEKAPETVKNFLTHVEDGFYVGTLFHRVIKGFMIQGGGFILDMKEKPTGRTIINEANNGLLNKKYAIAMARAFDPHSASSQFFINVVDNDSLDYRSPTPGAWGYAVFGEVIDGFDVVDKIAKVKTGFKGFHQDVPKEQIVIEAVQILSPDGVALTTS